MTGDVPRLSWSTAHAHAEDDDSAIDYFESDSGSRQPGHVIKWADGWSGRALLHVHHVPVCYSRLVLSRLVASQALMY